MKLLALCAFMALINFLEWVLWGGMKNLGAGLLALGWCFDYLPKAKTDQREKQRI